MIALTAHLQSELSVLNDALLMASISEEPLTASDVEALTAMAMDLLQNICGHHMQSETDASMAAVDVFGLCCAGLDYLGEDLDPELKVATLSALFLPIADTEGAASVELAMEWLQREGAVELIDEQEQARIVQALLHDDTLTSTAVTDHVEPDAPNLGEDQLEILGLLSAELEDMENQQSGFIASMNTVMGSDEKHILLSLASRHEHLANVCGMVNLVGLQLYFGHLQNNFEYLAEQENWQEGVEHLLTASLETVAQVYCLAIRSAGRNLVVRQLGRWKLAPSLT